jgi:trans-2-enoyl-CoA reductase
MKVLEKRICPDFDSYPKEFFRLKNGFENQTERYSFSVEIHLKKNVIDS